MVEWKRLLGHREVIWPKGGVIHVGVGQVEGFKIAQYGGRVEKAQPWGWSEHLGFPSPGDMLQIHTDVWLDQFNPFPN